MTKDRSERRGYRKSPGRQYGYDYNPLRGQSRSGQSQSGRSRASAPGERQAASEDSPGRRASRPGGYGGLELAPRPDPRRTRQLMRQSILASKAKTALYGEQEDEAQDELADQHEYEEQEEISRYSNRYPRDDRPARPRVPSQALYGSGNLDREAEEAELEEAGFVDPDIGIDPLEHEMDYPELSTRRREERGAVTRRNDLPEEYDDDDYYEKDRPRIRRKARGKNLSRRRLLVGLGTIAVGGAAVAAAAYELPKVPQAINDAGTNIEHQIQDAFNRGFSSGADAVRREFITALDQLEGISLDAAISAAKLTRVAFDVFVSPLVAFLANIADDFLTVTLRALITGRHWLGNIGQDNGTLGALQKVLESWVQDAKQMPKQLQAVADADLDGAQSYLRALKRKVNAEQSKLNGNSTPTIKPAPDPTATPHH
jgi:hypothetical protein